MLVDVLDSKLEEKLKPIYESIGEVKASLKFLSDQYDSVDKHVGELEIKCQTGSGKHILESRSTEAFKVSR